MNEDRVKKVHDELKSVGVGAIGMHTPESKHLASILHENEHIGGAVYGAYSDGLAWLVATNSRILFMDHKPFFQTTDEMTYDAVIGVRRTTTGLVDGIILHTRVNNYSIRFIRPEAATKFVSFVENRRLEGGEYNLATDHFKLGTNKQSAQKTVLIDEIKEEALNFLRRNETTVLSTVDRTGNVHGAVVYYLVYENKYIYILTKSETNKGRNIIANGQVALTFYEPGTAQTVQMQGIAEVEIQESIQKYVFDELGKPRVYVDQGQVPPIKKLDAGSFVVIRVTPINVKYHDYSDSQE